MSAKQSGKTEFAKYFATTFIDGASCYRLQDHQKGFAEYMQQDFLSISRIGQLMESLQSRYAVIRLSNRLSCYGQDLQAALKAVTEINRQRQAKKLKPLNIVKEII